MSKISLKNILKKTFKKKNSKKTSKKKVKKIITKKVKKKVKKKVIKQKKHGDNRGYLRETFRKKIIKWDNLIFDYCTTSKKNVLRGFHFQHKFQQAKFVSVLKGKILDCVVDLRKKSKTFGKSFSIILSEKNSTSLYIPEGFAHGFACLSNFCTVYYKCTNYRDKESEVTIKWNDKDLKIDWPIKKPILSKKDKEGMPFFRF